MVQSSNPKQKYQQQRGTHGKGGKSEPSLVVQHKQEAPVLVTVAETIETPIPQPQVDTPYQHHVISTKHELGEEYENIPELKLVKEKVEDKRVAVMDTETEELGDTLCEGEETLYETQEADTCAVSTIENRTYKENLVEPLPQTAQAKETTVQVYHYHYHHYTNLTFVHVSVRAEGQRKPFDPK